MTLAVLGAFALTVAAAGLWLHRSVHRPYKGYPSEEAVVEIRPGEGGARILERLDEAGVIADARLARAYLVYMLDDASLKAGEYRFAQPLSIPQVLDKLRRGEVLTHAVTLIEGLTLEETAQALVAAGFSSLEELLAAMRDPAPIADLDPEATDLEGYLFPDTYAFARGTRARALVGELVANFRRRHDALFAPLLAQRPGTTVRELVTLASIVEKEARLDEERPIIAGVYANRLERGIGLYADPTIIFALKRAGTWDGNLRKRDLELDSPYNTYRYPGLPPGPICSPGESSLAAAARPASVRYLYFVSRNDGSHVFAETLAEHNRNVHRWQKLYWQERWAKERAAEGGS